MKIKLIMLLFYISSCVIIPEKYLNEDSFNNKKINYTLNFEKTNIEEITQNLISCANFFEKHDRNSLNFKKNYHKNRIEKINDRVKKKFENLRKKETVSDIIYNISIKEIFCNNNYLNLERERNNASNNLIAYLLLGIIPSVVTYDTYFLVSINNEKYEEDLKFVVIQDQKLIFSIFSAPFSFIFEISEKRQNKFFDSIAEKIFIEIYLKLED
jgi:hypothetical protein